MHCNPYSQLVSTKVEGLSLQLTPSITSAVHLGFIPQGFIHLTKF